MRPYTNKYKLLLQALYRILIIFAATAHALLVHSGLALGNG